MHPVRDLRAKNHLTLLPLWRKIKDLHENTFRNFNLSDKFRCVNFFIQVAPPRTWLTACVHAYTYICTLDRQPCLPVYPSAKLCVDCLSACTVCMPAFLSACPDICLYLFSCLLSSLRSAFCDCSSLKSDFLSPALLCAEICLSASLQFRTCNATVWTQLFFVDWGLFSKNEIIKSIIR